MPHSKITPFLWFDDQAEEAAGLYASLFPDSRILEVTRYGSAGPRPEGMVMTVSFELDGQRFVGLNGGPAHRFTEAVSFVVDCETQEEVDRYWSTLAEGGEEGPCGWLKDRYGLSWQIVPAALDSMMAGADEAGRGRIVQAFMGMKKFDIAALEAAARG